MKRIKYQIVLILVCFATVSFGQSFPKSVGFINDFENIFTDIQEEVLDSIVKDFEKKSTIQIAIVTLNDSHTTKEAFDNYTLKLASYWGVGQKNKDNGVLIGVSSTFRKIRFQNGYGIEELLTDQETKILIDSLMIPEFKNGDYFTGTKNGIIGLINTLEDNSKSVQLDSMMTMIEKLIKDWDPAKEPWVFTSCELEEPNVTINYGQQAINPYLAEYARKIQFVTDNFTSDTLDMAINSGGRTFIKIYYDKVNKIIVMEDSFGGYYFDITTSTYSEKVWEKFEKYDAKEFLGAINGKEYPLKFEKK